MILSHIHCLLFYHNFDSVIDLERKKKTMKKKSVYLTSVDNVKKTYYKRRKDKNKQVSL